MIRGVGLGTARALLAVAAVLAVASTAGTAAVAPVPNVTFRGLDGSSIALSAFKGKVVLINFWGTWCVPCLREIPELVRLSQQFNTRGFVVVGIAVDSGHPDDIRAFLAEHGMDYPILMGDLGSNLEQIPNACEPEDPMPEEKIPLAPAYYIGRQAGVDSSEGFDLYNLTTDIPGHPKHSTVSGETLAAAGFRLRPRSPDPSRERALAHIDRLRSSLSTDADKKD